MTVLVNPQTGPSRARIPQDTPRGRAYSNPGALPAILLVNSFEGGTNATTISTANAGGSTGYSGGPASNNQFTAIATAGTGTLKFDNTHAAHGSLSLKATTLASGDTASCRWQQQALGSQTKYWFREYLYFTANPASAQCRIFSATNSIGTATAVSVSVLTSGKLTVQDNASATMITFSGTIPLNEWFRVEGFISSSPSAGYASLSLYSPLDSLIPVETHTSTATFNTLDNAAWIYFGIAFSNAVAQGPYWMDDVAVSNTGPLGPVSYPGPPSTGHPGSVVQQRILQVFSKGRAYSNPGGPVNNPAPGPVFYPRVTPARAPVPQIFSKGHVGSNPGSAPRNPIPGPVFVQAVKPARAPIPQVFSKGRVGCSAGAPVRNPNPGPVFHQAVHPIRVIIPQNAPRGRVRSNPGGPVVLPRFLRFKTGTPCLQWAAGIPCSQWAAGTPALQWAVGPAETST